MAAGEYHTVLLRDDGEAVAFGHNGVGQCAVPARPAGTRYVAAAAGRFHTVLLRDDGEAVAFGYNADGQCTLGLTRAHSLVSRLMRALAPGRRYVRGRRGGVPDWRSVVLLVVYRGEEPGLRAVADALGPRELTRRLLRH